MADRGRGVSPAIGVGNASLYFIPFAVGNLAGPLLLGHLFDTIGRRKMIFATYGISAVILAVSAVLFHSGVPDRQRDLPARATWSGDRVLLRDRTARGTRRARLVRRADRGRLDATWVLRPLVPGDPVV